MANFSLTGKLSGGLTSVWPKNLWRSCDWHKQGPTTYNYSTRWDEDKLFRESERVCQTHNTNIDMCNMSCVECPPQCVVLYTSMLHVCLLQLKIMSSIHETQPTIQRLLSDNEFIGALDLISTSQDVLAKDLGGIHSFRCVNKLIGEGNGWEVGETLVTLWSTVTNLFLYMYSDEIIYVCVFGSYLVCIKLFSVHIFQLRGPVAKIFWWW